MTINPCIITCLNERPAVSKIVLRCAARLGLPMVGAVHDVDDGVLLCKWTQWAVPVLTNAPAEKWNTTLQFAVDYNEVEFGRFTHFLIMGDDDSLSTYGFELLAKAAKEGHDYVGFKTNAFYELKTGKAIKQVQRFKCDKLIGAGRMISRRAIEAVAFRQDVVMARDFGTYEKGNTYSFTPKVADYLIGYHMAKAAGDPRYVGLWDPKRKRGLDHDSELRLVMNGFVPHAVDDGRIHVTDFKGENNIWTFSILADDIRLKCKPIAGDEATWFMSDREREYIETFRK